MLRGLLVLVALLVFTTASACGGDDDDSNGSSAGSGDAPAASDGGDSNDDTSSGDDEGSDDNADDSDDDAPPVDSGGGSGSEVGFVMADGQRFSVSEVRRCEPFFDSENDLDLQALASSGVILFVVLNSPAATLVEQEISIQGGGLGVFGGGAYSLSGGEPWFDAETDAELLAPPFSVAGNHVSGLHQLAEARGSGETLDVSFEIPIPDEIIDC